MHPAAELVPNRRRTFSDPDPLLAAMAPPPNETPAQRDARVRAEQEAQRVSDGIDAMLLDERAERRKRREIKVLLLGQSESGKSTTLKQFQLLHTPAAFRAERIAWRLVIYLNIVRSVRRILDAITPDEPLTADSAHFSEDDLLRGSAGGESLLISAEGAPASALAGTPVPKRDAYARRLAPLLALEETLMHALAHPDEPAPAPAGEPSAQGQGQGQGGEQGPLTPSSSWGWGRHAHSPAGAGTGTGGASGSDLAPSSAFPFPPANGSAPPPPVGGSPVSPGSAASGAPPRTRSGEPLLSARSNWKKAFSLGGRLRAQSPKSAHTNEIEGWWEDAEDPVHVMYACAGVVEEMWRDPAVRVRLKERRLRIEESSGFYLDDIERVTAKRWFPNDNDVLKARLKTTGVVEHTFTLKAGGDIRGMDWKIYDVGGERNQRQAWAPYFEDVNAIIFLAPISAFDQVLAEDPRVNRLEDSFMLWKSIVANRLLARVNIVLFLNKCDLLQRKLAAGARIGSYMISYGDRPNDYESVSKYFRNKFGAVHQTYSPNKERDLFIHLTSVTDTRRTALLINQVRDIILKAHLKYSHFV